MYRYDEFDAKFVAERTEQFRFQVERRLKGELTEDQFKPFRLMNGLYLQLHAYMLRVAVPYGELSSRQLRVLARIAREFDHPSKEVFEKAIGAQAARERGLVDVTVGHLAQREEHTR